ncbi:hypothetical protein [Mycoplasma sp. SG1]|uniref:hypothetical protein n=1 Tax=Mycoplasma sp. SG1 TaxID=2810348 RepID=UPI002AFFE18A|nr:hypothetical protein [Mycoplasma sp. SG1]URM52867.1 hypothetical protein JRW51_00785 [Mycoplasma sp. SG1]
MPLTNTPKKYQFKQKRLLQLDFAHKEYSASLLQQMLNNEECLAYVARRITSLTGDDFHDYFKPLAKYLLTQFSTHKHQIGIKEALTNFPETDYPEIYTFIVDAYGKGVNRDKLEVMVDEFLNISTRIKMIFLLNTFLEKKIYSDTKITENTFEYITDLESQLNKLVQVEFTEQSYFTIDRLGARFLEKIRTSAFKSDIIPLGYKQLDSMLNIKKGDLVIVAGRPSMGKQRLR